MATLEDRIVQTAMKLIIEPIFEADFQECSYEYRPKRNAQQGREAIRTELYQQAGGVVEIDFQDYFTHIPHNRLLMLISDRISDGSMLKLIKQTLKIGMSYQGQVKPTTIGVPQGSPISPLYSNIYLNVIDKQWQGSGYPEKWGAPLHRYADEVIRVCRKSAYPVLKAFSDLAKQMELTLNGKKTRFTQLTQGFDFLGIQFVKRRSQTSGKNTIYRFASKPSQQKIRSRLKGLTRRKAPIKPEEFTALIKPVVLGGVNYS
jgi:group II intron reverse transcriptase/maturase